MNYKEYFKGKNVAVIGLGPHGEMVADIKFILRLGANVSFYDIRSERRLEKYVNILSEAGLLKCTFGKVPGKEISESDLVIISPEISRKALFLKEATEAGIPISFPNILFLKLAPPVTLIGVMGACGKSTISHMIYSTLKKSFSGYENQGLFFIDPDLPNGALTHLKKIKAGDVVLTRIPEEMMIEYYNVHISPHVAVITTLTSSALREARSAFSILEYQTYNNFIVAPNGVVDAIWKQKYFTPKAKMLRVHGDNKSIVLQTVELFKVNKEDAEKSLENFSGLKGHQEFIKKVGGIEFYNDTASVNPYATMNALQKLSVDRNTILIFGGAYTGYDYGDFIKNVSDYVHTIILIPGSATLGFRSEIETLKNIISKQARDLNQAVEMAREYGKKGDRVLFSPGCEAIGIDISRRERGEKFVKAVRGL